MSENNQSGNKSRSNNQNRSNQSGNRNQNRNSNRGRQNSNSPKRGPRPAPKPLTFWQKLLAVFGVKPKPQTPVKSNRTSSTTPKPQAKSPANPQKPRPPRKVEVTSGRLYVGNLSYETTEHDLEELFKGNGTVKSVEIIYNRHTHKSKGYGFIEMLSKDDAKNAVSVHHDQPFMGRNLIVNGARNRQEEDSRSNSQSQAAETTV